ncbi:MAG: zinc ribbon domain-containing protein [Chloroflexi bacterium]|nr:zinc ribbon domain-containing protein [Chloroflexota bacterium]
MTLPANLNVYISAIMFLLGAYIFALYVGMIVWTVRDIRARSRDVLAQILATVLVATFTLPGLLIYLLLRPHTTLAEEYERSLAEEALLQELEERRVCPGCRHRIDPDFVVCPYCHYQLRLRCVSCRRLLNPNWDVCPYCGHLREEGEGEATTSQEEPAPLEPKAPATFVAESSSAQASPAISEAPSDEGQEEEPQTPLGEPAAPYSFASWRDTEPLPLGEQEEQTDQPS